MSPEAKLQAAATLLAGLPNQDVIASVRGDVHVREQVCSLVDALCDWAEGAAPTHAEGRRHTLALPPTLVPNNGHPTPQAPEQTQMPGLSAPMASLGNVPVSSPQPPPVLG